MESPVNDSCYSIYKGRHVPVMSLTINSQWHHWDPPLFLAWLPIHSPKRTRQCLCLPASLTAIDKGMLSYIIAIVIPLLCVMFSLYIFVHPNENEVFIRTPEQPTFSQSLCFFWFITKRTVKVSREKSEDSLWFKKHETTLHKGLSLFKKALSFRCA